MHRIFPGYPPADHEVRDFLTKKGTEGESYRRACCFIDALFEHTDFTLKQEFDSQQGIEEVTFTFRKRMTDGQTMKNHNEFRRQFYQQVVRIADGKLVCLLYLGYIRRLEVSHKVAQPGSDTVPGSFRHQRTLQMIKTPPKTMMISPPPPPASNSLHP